MKTLSKLLGTTVLLGVFGNIVAVNTASAQMAIFGRSTDLPSIQSQIANGTIWSLAAGQPGFENCDKNFTISKPSNRQLYAAKERYAASLAMQQCVANLRSLLVTEATSKAASPLVATVDTNSIAVTFQALEAQTQTNVNTTGADTNFMGLSFGVGLGVSYSSSKRVSAAEVAADGTIRATKTETEEPRVILESHYYDWCKTPSCKAGTFGFGPYFGIVAKDDKLISAISAGAMVGWKSGTSTDSKGFSIGLGWILDADVSSLAPGFEVGKPLPTGETAVKFESKSRSGALLFFTRTF